MKARTLPGAGASSRDEDSKTRDFSDWPFPPNSPVIVDGAGSHWRGTFLRPTGSGMCEVAPTERTGKITPTRLVRLVLLSAAEVQSAK